MPLPSQQKKQEKLLARRDADGYPGLIPLKEIYHFEDFLTHERDWHSAVTKSFKNEAQAHGFNRG